ncbi:hypothetical protein QVD17_12082 [Tagetes erecta]|uniref:Uncharacterized protein n=1 Tax=Tagetes erecta TaxID=13708 RepID=A0AAD8P1F3_TARER|nr:hypothetical protein QVD17_12082 [Tagetes erecta]
MYAPPYKCCVQVPVRMIGKDQTNLNRSHHSSSSVKAAALHLSSPLFLLIWKTGVAFGSKGMVFSMSPDRPPLVRLASEWFFRAGSRPGPTGGHPPQRKQHCSPPPEKQKILESRLKIHA